MKPWLWIPPELAHKLNPFFLPLISKFCGSKKTPVWNEQTFSLKNKKSLVFKNPLGIAGGVDKSGVTLLAWQNLGCGFLEVGTITPHPQTANTGRIMDRNIPQQALWNKMGFPSDGGQIVKNQILKNKHLLSVPLFINIGKNRTTANENAHLDYQQLIKDFSDVADAFVINISSPNTSGLRDLAQPLYLQQFLSPLIAEASLHAPQVPLLIKLSPDHTASDLEVLIRTCIDLGIDGFILTNTTLSRQSTPDFPKDGGVSGKPLKQLSLQALKIAKSICAKENDKKIIISSGGVMTAADVFERIESGADLVQVYSALIFEGPSFFRKVARIAKNG